MIESKNIPALIKKCEVIYFSISDLDGNHLFRADCQTPASAVEEWNGLVKYLNGYKKIMIDAGTKATKDRTNAKKYTWEVWIDSEVKNNSSQVSGTQAQSGMTASEIEKYVDAKVSTLSKDIELDFLRKQVAGMKPEDAEGDRWARIIEKGLFGSGNTSTLHGAPEQLNVEQGAEVAAELERLMESILKKVNHKKIIKLLQAVDKNPSLVDKALNFLS